MNRWTEWSSDCCLQLFSQFLPGKLFFFFSFLGPHLQHMEVPGLGVKLELQLPAYTTAQQHWIQAASATCTTACNNIRSLSH